MSAPVEDASAAHKRTASATSALQNSPPPAKRTAAAAPAPAAAAAPPTSRGFPHAVALVFFRDGVDDVSATTTVLGVYASLADANDEVRRQGLEQGTTKLADEAATVAATKQNNNSDPLRWDTPDGLSCWVELHAVTPRTIRSSGGSPDPQKKLYDAEEGEDPDLDDDDQDEGGHYD